mmetsp:Transcript_140999/g.351635  ORF Transcript_140999/g.351635 Transcript_140999/m.351635 type:complete len:225 (+) Transcript_140999:1347-2021(+)
MPPRLAVNVPKGLFDIIRMSAPIAAGNVLEKLFSSAPWTPLHNRLCGSSIGWFCTIDYHMAIVVDVHLVSDMQYAIHLVHSDHVSKRLPQILAGGHLFQRKAVLVAADYADADIVLTRAVGEDASRVLTADAGRERHLELCCCWQSIEEEDDRSSAAEKGAIHAVAHSIQGATRSFEREHTLRRSAAQDFDFTTGSVQLQEDVGAARRHLADNKHGDIDISRGC